MKVKYLLLAAAVAAIAVFTSSTREKKDKTNDSVLKVLEDVPTVQAFLKDPVPEADLKRIVNAGVNAPSGMNRQPWHFTVISSPEEIAAIGDAQKESMKNMKFPPAPPKGMNPGEAGPRPPMPGGKGPKSGLGDSPVVIVISCKPGSEFDAGLACESMNDMANALGYGTKIISSCTILFNGDNKASFYEKFQIPEGQTIVAAILLGKTDSSAYDAVSSATPRNPFEDVVSFL